MDNNNYFEFIVETIWKEWSQDYVEYTEIKNINKLREDLQDKTIYLVCDENNNLCSFCLIEDNDMNIKPEYSPWLSSVYTLPEKRHNGYAKLLLEEVVMHEKDLYLYCSSQLVDFYKKIGFNVIDKYNRCNNIIFIMKK